jgi:hypothetical protein
MIVFLRLGLGGDLCFAFQDGYRFSRGNLLLL